VIHECKLDQIQIATCSTETNGDIEQNITKWRKLNLFKLQMRNTNRYNKQLLFFHR